MSGGKWQYLAWRIRQAAEEIEQEIQGGGYEPETLACLRDAACCLRKAAVYEHRVDYLLCHDHGEEGFRRALAVDLDEVEAHATTKLRLGGASPLATDAELWTVLNGHPLIEE